MKLTIVIEKVKDGTKKLKDGMFIKYKNDEGVEVMAASEMPKGSAFADELKDIIKQMKKLAKKK